MTFRHLFFLLIIAALLVTFAACGGSSSTPPPPITVAFSTAPPASMNTSATATMAAVVANDSKSGGVTWTVTCGSADCGSFNPTSTASGASTTYTAPAAVPTGNTVTIKATSVSDTSKFVSATVTITQAGAISVTLNPAPPAAISKNGSAAIAAVVTNDAQNGGVDWTVTCGSSSCGSFSSTHTASGVTTTYTAPAAIPTPNTVTVTATSTTDNTKSASADIIIANLGDGTYVFQVSGADQNDSPFNLAGAFTVAGGVITGGEEDFVDFLTVGIQTINGGTSSINLTPDGNLAIVLDANTNGPETLIVTLTGPNSGLITAFDSFLTGSGTLSLQTAAAQSTTANGYAFLTSGYDVGGCNIAVGGVANVDPSTAAVSGFFDVSDCGAFTQQVALANTSNVTAPDALGRVAFTLDSVGSEIVLIGYIVDSSTIALVETADGLTGTTGGTAFAQGATNTGNFSNASVSGSNYAVGAQGGDVNYFSNLGGEFIFNADQSVSGFATYNDGAFQVIGTVSAPAGSYSVDATGRVTVNNVTLTDGVNTFGPATVQFYLDGNGNALFATMDNSDVNAGPAYKQTLGAVVSGNYALSGFGVDFSSFFWSAVGPMTVNGGIIANTSFTDYNFDSVTTPNVALTGTIASGTGSIVGLDADNPANTDTFTFYLIDNNRAFGIESDANQLGLLYIQRQQ